MNFRTFANVASIRQVLLFLCLACLAPFSLMAADEPAEKFKSAKSPPRPSIVMILGDDHAPYTIGAYGSEIARTPNLDKFAAESALFTRAYCNSPVCTASRGSFLTGRLPHANGVSLLSTPLPENELTLAEYLKTAGYRTAAIGKMHFNSALKHGFDLRVDAPDYKKWLQQKGVAPINQPGTLGKWRPMADPARDWLNGGVLPFPATDANMEATYFVERARQFIEECGEQPFFLLVSFNQPHSPFHFPIDVKQKFDPAKLPIPLLYPEDPPQIPLVFRDLTDADKKGIIASYHTTVEYLDGKIGAVWAALQESPQYKSMFMLYTSDHGYLLGHHGRFEKHSFFEEAVRAPLMIRWPSAFQSKKVHSLVELVDLFPTITDVAGLPPASFRHGKSLMPVLRGETLDQEHRYHVVSQYHENEEAMIRTDRYKLIYCSGKRSRLDGYKTHNPTPGRHVRLYDLKDDPNETHDLSRDPFHAERVAELKHQLLVRLDSAVSGINRAPRTLSVEDRLDWYLVPPELKAKG